MPDTATIPDDLAAAIQQHQQVNGLVPKTSDNTPIPADLASAIQQHVQSNGISTPSTPALTSHSPSPQPARRLVPPPVPPLASPQDLATALQNRAFELNPDDSQIRGMLNTTLPPLARNPPADKSTLRAFNAARTAAAIANGVPLTAGDTNVGMTAADVKEGLLQTPRGIAQFGAQLAAPIVNAGSNAVNYTADQLAQVPGQIAAKLPQGSLRTALQNVGPYGTAAQNRPAQVNRANPVDVFVGKEQQTVPEQPGQIASAYLTAAGLPTSLANAIATGQDPVAYYKQNPGAIPLDLSIALMHIPGVGAGVHAATFGALRNNIERFRQAKEQIAASTPQPSNVKAGTQMPRQIGPA